MTKQRRLVRPSTERDVARALGATPHQAEALVGKLSEAGLLTHGVVVIGAVAAARWGVLLPDAIVDMAEGRGMPEGISPYELRTAAEEGEADVEAAWAAAQDAGQEDVVWRRLHASASEVTQGDLDGQEDDAVPASPFNIDVPALLRR